MAANRTFQFYGIGYGNTPVTVTARVNSTEIFSGEIATIDQPIDPAPYPIPDIAKNTVLFNLEDSALLNTDFAGSLPMTVEVTGGLGALFSWIDSNYYQGNTQTDPAAGTSSGFAQCYYGTPTNSEGTPDPRSSVAINGVQQVPPLEPSTGCWIWLVPAGSTLSYNWNIATGQIGNTVGNFGSYTAPV
jgi:hypothetical protein